MGKGPKYTLPKDNILWTVVNRHMERCSASLIISEMRVKITERYLLTLSEWLL